MRGSGALDQVGQSISWARSPELLAVNSGPRESSLVLIMIVDEHTLELAIWQRREISLPDCSASHHPAGGAWLDDWPKFDHAQQSFNACTGPQKLNHLLDTKTGLFASQHKLINRSHT